jgi:hypothetical protein
MMMKRLRVRGIAVIAIAILWTQSLFGGAQAATNGPADSYITLQTPVLDATNTSLAVENQKMADSWVGNGWFGSGLIYQVSFAPVGSTINLTYNVKDKSGKPLTFTSVNLRINKGYSESASIVEVDGVKTRGVDRPPFDQANVIHKTDAFGNVTFAMKNLDSEVLGEKEPESFTSKPIFSDDKLDRLHSQVLPEVNSEPADHSVISEFHYYVPKSPIVVPATRPTIKLVTPVLNLDNSVLDATRNLKQAYAPMGSDIVVAYKVTGDDGRAVPNKVVTLKINDGKSSLQATTDAFGFAVFTLKNADTKPNAAPSSATANMPKASTAFAKITPEITGTTAASADSAEFHYYRGVTTSVSKEGKKFTLNVAVAGAAGKSAKVEVTGVKAKTVKLTSAMQSIPVAVTAGTKTVTVTIDGKKYTSKTVIK